MATTNRLAVIAGVGPGLGHALTRRFAQEGYHVVMIARDGARLAEFANEDPAHLEALVCDLTNGEQVRQALDAICELHGPPDCAVFNAGTFSPGAVLDLDPAEFERCWRVGAFAGLLFAQTVARQMARRGSGTILFTGATASLRGAANFANLASPKFALRALAQSMARELGPLGIHVAHIIIDGQIRSDRYEHLLTERGPDSLLDANTVADTYWNLHLQPRSAWSFEVDLRPWIERF